MKLLLVASLAFCHAEMGRQRRWRMERRKKAAAKAAAERREREKNAPRDAESTSDGAIANWRQARAAARGRGQDREDAPDGHPLVRLHRAQGPGHGRDHVPLAQGPRQGPERRVVGRADGGVSNVCVYQVARRVSSAAAKLQNHDDAAAAVVPRSKRLSALERRRRRLDAFSRHS